MSAECWDNSGIIGALGPVKKIHILELTYKWPVPGVQMADSRTSVLELILELVLELQMASSRTPVLELVLELVQELVLEVQMAGSRTSVLELHGSSRTSS